VSSGPAYRFIISEWAGPLRSLVPAQGKESVHVCVRVSVCMCAHVRVRMCMHVCVCVHACTCVCVCGQQQSQGSEMVGVSLIKTIMGTAHPGKPTLVLALL
jgi:hypothetical protein